MNRYITWAQKQQLGDPLAKSVLVCLGDRANDEATCRPSVRRICEDTDISDRTVRAKIAWLIERGLVERLEVPGRSSTYRLIVDSDPCETDTPAAVAGPPLRDPHTPVSEPEVEPKPSPASPSKEERDQVWDSLVDVFGQPTTTPARSRYGKTVRELLTDTSLAPGEVAVAIPIRAMRIREAWPGITLTPEALVKHWSAFAPARTPEPQQVVDLEDDGTGRRTF